MKKFTSKTLNYILLGVLIVIFTVLACLGLGNIYAPSTYYRTGEISKATLNALVYKINYGENEKLNSVWLNFGSQPKDAKTITVYSRIASSTGVTFNALNTKNFVADEDIVVGGWSQIASPEDVKDYSSRSYFMLAVDGEAKITFNEIVFVGEKDGKLVKLAVESYGSGAKSALTTALDNSGELQTNDIGKLEANKLIDETKTFSLSRIDGNSYNNDARSLLTPVEINTAQGVKNILDGTSYYVDGTFNPLGGYIMAIGTSIFGYTALGMRIVPLIFSVATLVALFFLGKLVTNREICGLLLSFLYAVGGYSLAFANVGTTASIFAFFVVLCLYFAFRFYRYGVDFKAPAKGSMNILFSGLAFSIVIGVKSQAVLLCPALVAVAVAGGLRQYKKYYKRVKEKHADKPDKDIKKNFTQNLFPEIGVFAAAFVILPLLVMVGTFILSYATYSAAYNTPNLFNYMSAHFKTGFLTGEGLNLGRVLINSTAVVSGNRFIFANVLTTVLGVIAMACCLGYLVVTLACKKAQTQIKINTFVYPTVVSLIGFLSFWLVNGLLGASVEIYFIAFIFTAICATLLFNTYDLEYSKPVFAVKGQGITVVQIITAVLALAFAVTFGLAVPALTGLGNALIHVNVLGFVL